MAFGLVLIRQAGDCHLSCIRRLSAALEGVPVPQDFNQDVDSFLKRLAYRFRVR